MTELAGPAPRLGPPSSISEQARGYLAARWQEPTEYPDAGDTDGWLRLIEQRDNALAGILSALPTLPAQVEATDIAGVPAFVIRANDVPDRDDTPVYLDIHGGGLVLGSGEACRAMGILSALGTGLIHWAVDYRMPPKHPYPAALDDCVAVYRQLLAERDPRTIFVGGASAGGNLAAATLLRARDEGLAMPAGLILLSPEVDLTESGDSFRANMGIDNVLTSSLLPASLLYANGRDLADPYLSPLFGDLAGFPPTFIQSGTRDLLLSNAVRMHRRLRDVGVQAELHVFEAMPHGGLGGAPEDADLRAELRRFIDRVRSAADAPKIANDGTIHVPAFEFPGLGRTQR